MGLERFGSSDPPGPPGGQAGMPVPGKSTSRAVLAEQEESVILRVGAVGMDLDVLAPLPGS